MADDTQFSSRSDNKRKHEEDRGASPAAATLRATGFSASPASDSPSPFAAAAAGPPPSYNSVAPPLDGIQLAVQRAQEIAARLLRDAEAKRLRVENGGSGEDAGAQGFGSSTDGPSHLHKPLGQIMANAQVNLSTPSSFATYGYSGTNKKIEIPNGTVGVIIGKGGETIKYLQLQSGAKIQVTRDADSDPNSQTRNVELTGTAEQINRAEQLINDVLQEAEVRGSGMTAAQKLAGDQPGSEQLIIKVPNHKVGMLIGKSGETIKNMQAQSGARIQIIPLHLPPGDTSTERNVHIHGTNEQIESARQLISEVISKENRVRNPPDGRYPQQSFCPPLGPTSWGPPGALKMQQPGYGYMPSGAYPGPTLQYSLSQPPYAPYPLPAASVGYSGSWDHTSNTAGQQTTSGTGYEYYNQQQLQQQPLPVVASSAPDGSTYNYGQPQSSAYSTQGSYSDSAYSHPPVTQSQGYSQESYSGSFHSSGDQTGYTHPQSNVQHVYDLQQNHGPAPAYGETSQSGSTAAYGAQSDLVQLPPAVQPPVNQEGYPAQQSSSTLASYSQTNGQPGYGTSQTSQPGYVSQLPVAGYGQTRPSQPSYVQPHQDQTPPAEPIYGQGQQPANTQVGYVQPVPVEPGYTQPQSGYAQQDSAQHLAPPSGFGSAGPLPGYGQQQSHGGVPPQSQTGYGIQQQQSSSYGSGSAGTCSQIPAHSTEGEVGVRMNGSYDAPATQSVPSGITKASHES